MKQIYIGAGTNLEYALRILQEQEIELHEPVWTYFNNRIITSEMSLDMAYLAVTGIHKDEAELFDKIWPFIHGLVLEFYKDKSSEEIGEALHKAHIDFGNFLTKINKEEYE